MKTAFSKLYEAFREDHAILGRGLYEIATALRGGDLPAARAAAERLDSDVGAHMAFEERFFYPALRDLIGDDAVDRFHAEHHDGLAAIQTLEAVPDTVEMSAAEVAGLLASIDRMQTHVTECGEMFGAMGRIPTERQESLYRELVDLRREAPRWSDIAGQSDG